ncbi:MAG: hypothetical protein PVF08_00050 [Gammaproteobacteria bacterium]|jgi:hypothetical protein
MRRGLNKFLLILVTLAVANAPLSGARALPDAGTPDPASHCSGMQHAAQPMNQHTGHAGITDNGVHKCKTGCNGGCCNQDCSVCLHNITAAMPAGAVVVRDTPVYTYGMPADDTFPERPPTPPLRPPHPLQG